MNIHFCLLRVLSIFFLALLLFVAGCAKGGDAHTLVLAYDDFGPMSMSWELIGLDVWQWENSDDGDPNSKYPIKVVVYKDIPLETVQRTYPVVPEKEQDYRYVRYSDALIYLDLHIADMKNDIAGIKASLKKDTQADVESEIAWRLEILQELERTRKTIERKFKAQ